MTLTPPRSLDFVGRDHFRSRNGRASQSQMNETRRRHWTMEVLFLASSGCYCHTLESLVLASALAGLFWTNRLSWNWMNRKSHAYLEPSVFVPLFGGEKDFHCEYCWYVALWNSATLQQPQLAFTSDRNYVRDSSHSRLLLASLCCVRLRIHHRVGFGGKKMMSAYHKQGSSRHRIDIQINRRLFFMGNSFMRMNKT